MVRGVLYWTLTILGSIWWWRTVYDQVPQLGLPWLTAFSVLCLTALAGCWTSVRFNWNFAKFPLALAVLSAFAWDIIRIAGLYNLSAMRFTYTVFLPMASSRAWWSISLNTWVNAASYIAFIGGSLFLMRRTAPSILSRIILFTSMFVGLTLTAQAAYCFGFLMNDFRSWGHFFFALPFLVLIFWLRRVFMKNKIFNDYKRPLAYSTGAFLILLARDFYISFFVEGAALSVFIPTLNTLVLSQAVFLGSLILWIRVFIFKAAK